MTIRTTTRYLRQNKKSTTQGETEGQGREEEVGCDDTEARCRQRERIRENETIIEQAEYWH